MDRPEDWHVCGATDVRCDICDAREKRGEGMIEAEEGNSGMEEQVGGRNEEGEKDDGLVRLRRRQMQEQYEMDVYMEGLWQVQGGRRHETERFWERGQGGMCMRCYGRDHFAARMQVYFVK